MLKKELIGAFVHSNRFRESEVNELVDSFSVQISKEEYGMKNFEQVKEIF